MNLRLDWDAVRAGAALALAVAVGTMVVVELLDAAFTIDGDSNWVFLFYAVVLAGLVAGARLAARRRRDAPVLHGTAAALAAYTVVAALGVVLRLTVDKGPEPVALAFNALMAASAGILGGLLAESPASSPDGQDVSAP